MFKQVIKPDDILDLSSGIIIDYTTKQYSAEESATHYRFIGYAIHRPLQYNEHVGYNSKIDQGAQILILEKLSLSEGEYRYSAGQLTLRVYEGSNPEGALHVLVGIDQYVCAESLANLYQALCGHFEFHRPKDKAGIKTNKELSNEFSV